MRSILCFGDSNTWGYNPEHGERFSESERWTGVLRKELGNDFLVIEEGLCGRTTVFEDPLIPYRSGSSYILPCLESHKPLDLCIVMLGTNDLKTRLCVSAQEIAMGMDRLIGMILGSGSGPGEKSPAVMLVSPAPLAEGLSVIDFLPDGYKKSLRLAGLYRQAARERGIHYMDAGKSAQVSASEGIHLTRESHQTLGMAAAEAVSSML